MDPIQQLISDHLNVWTTAESEKKSSRGRSSSNSGKIYGIEKLRELILNLAIEGKVTTQNPNDEPASELLKRIELERINLLKKRNQKPLEPISNEEIPFKLPKGWAWVRNNQLFNLRKGKIPKSLNENGAGLPYLDIEALDRNLVRRYSEDSMCPISKETDILVVCDGSRSGLVLNGKHGIIGSTLSIIDTPIFIQPFIKLIFKQGFKDFNTSMKGAAIPHLDTQKLLQNITALPPLLEQHRIVSKVDELMTLCDQLEQQHINSEEAHGKLFKVLLNSLTQSKDAEEFKDNWQRISNHFDTLFTTQGSINELKQTLLELAVMGKLVPQDPNDEPARDLLKRLQEDKVKNITKASNKKDNLLSTSTDLSPFKLPYTWAYEKLGNLSSLITKGTTPTSLGFAYETNGINFIKVENIKNERINLSSIDQFISPETNNALSRSQLEEGDVLFSIAGTIGKTCIVNKEDLPANTNQALAIIRGTKQIFNQNFLLYQLNSLVSNKVKEKARGGAMNNVSLSDLSELIVVIPPTHEQDRIITKLDELMNLCEELKSRIQQASAKQKQIADVLVSQALN
jgi:type I restriction enzyme S subunit